MLPATSIELSLFTSRIEAVCDEMGVVLRRAAFSPNIKDRLDFSCALFDASGQLAAQAAHIPVHLGSMAFAMQAVVAEIDWQPGDQVIWNDPYLGGTHLPDVTLVAPVFYSSGQLAGFVANRAHYADIGAAAPGSMPLTCDLNDEGVLIRPQKICKQGRMDPDAFAAIINRVRNPKDAQGDLQAQMGCNRRGAARLSALIKKIGPSAYERNLRALNTYAETMARREIARIPDGQYQFVDELEDDGCGAEHLQIQLLLTVLGNELIFDFAGTAAQTRGNFNCPLPVTAAAVWYVLRCLLPENIPSCAGCFKPLALQIPRGSLLNARFPAAVAAGNVETSSRIVDVVLGAFSQALPDCIPAASQGTMNNIAFGSEDSVRGPWGYYETLGGGLGASRMRRGISARQSHMTNTRNTPVEVLEQRYPIRIQRYAIRKESGGAGLHCGGDGLVREYEFLQAVQCTLLSERRVCAPWGLHGGQSGALGRNVLNDQLLPGKIGLQLQQGDRLRLETPGGGGWGERSDCP